MSLRQIRSALSYFSKTCKHKKCLQFLTTVPTLGNKGNLKELIVATTSFEFERGHYRGHLSHLNFEVEHQIYLPNKQQI